MCFYSSRFFAFASSEFAIAYCPASHNIRDVIASSSEP